MQEEKQEKPHGAAKKLENIKSRNHLKPFKLDAANLIQFSRS